MDVTSDRPTVEATPSMSDPVPPAPPPEAPRPALLDLAMAEVGNRPVEDASQGPLGGQPWWTADLAMASQAAAAAPSIEEAKPAAEGTMGHRPGGKLGGVWDSNQRDVAAMDLTLSKSQQRELAAFKANYAKNYERYQAVAERAGVPAMLVAAIHYREGSSNFGTYLHNGQKLGRTTTIVPKGIKFDDWDDAAVHALKMKSKLRDEVGLTADSRDPVAMATYAEAYNGLGYHKKGLPSPYLYAGSDVYEKGMYVSDGKFSKNTVDKRLGVMTILQAMDGFDPKAVGAAGPAPSAGWQKVVDGRSTLRVDARGDAVSALQERLAAAGVQVKPDGKFGPKTKAAVMAFQQANGLAPDGVVGPATSRALQAAADKAAAPKEVVTSRPPGDAPAEAEAAPAKAEVAQVAVDDEAGKTKAQPLSPEAQQRHLTELEGILAAKWGATKVSRDGKTDERSAKLVQRALVELGYLPEGTAVDGKWGPLSTNALMAFQVASSGVDTIEKSRDAKGRPVYMSDKDKPRLKGIVTGKLDNATKKKLLGAIETQRDAIAKDGTLPELKVMHELGESPEQKAQLRAKVADLGLPRGALESVDVAAYRELGLRPHVLAAAVDGWKQAFLDGKTKNTVVTVTDYELPANMRRSFTIDLAKGGQPMFQQVLAHGSGSDAGDGSGLWSTKFGGAQRDGSHQSMLGGFVAGAESYSGSKVSGTHVEGIERGINDKAAPRLIRTHGPTRNTWDSNSQIGRNVGYHSWGCMVMDRSGAAAFKKMTEGKGGTYLFNFAPHEQYWGKKQPS
ncbi:MAG: peptidoglycan-binding protein [Myxococcota bacterium]